MEQRLVRMSKFLSYLLRHHPEAEGLSMDEHGWVSVEELLHAPGAKKRAITRDLLSRVVAENDKQRFEFDEDGRRIRARQGHSRRVSLDWTPVTPPEYLYHGTSSLAVSSIRQLGLHKRNRHHVHLSLDAATARRVGARHGHPSVLLIRAREMHGKGYSFFVSANGIWLTESVPIEFIEFP
jgi:putative RNA 2'-phosphotransferase